MAIPKYSTKGSAEPMSCDSCLKVRILYDYYGAQFCAICIEQRSNIEEFGLLALKHNRLFRMLSEHTEDMLEFYSGLQDNPQEDKTHSLLMESVSQYLKLAYKLVNWSEDAKAKGLM